MTVVDTGVRSQLMVESEPDVVYKFLNLANQETDIHFGMLQILCLREINDFPKFEQQLRLNLRYET